LGLRKEKRFARYQPIFGSPDLINSDLFGHRRGAFTGALEDRIGMIELCDDGTFFLDEIDELPRETQIVLLGVLQERSFRRIGESEERMIRVRFVSASNADIQAKIKDGTFRNDLFHRIAQVEIRIPPLRDRLSDIQELTEHILSFAQTSVGLPLLLVSPEAVRVLQSHHWPGNVRELESVVQAAGWRTFQRGDTEIRATDIRLNARAPLSEDVSNRSFRDQVRAFEQKLIDEALTRNGQNISAVARELGIDRGTIRKIRGGEG
jgi:transcriptional regulator with PAS, ATPase and Fis domain